MPTRIDVGAKAAHKEIDEIKNNIKSSLSTVGGGGSNPNLNEEQQQQLISPLFRDEVQHQEMQYLDGLLMEENRKSSEEKSEPSPALQQQQQSEVQYQSKLASILKPYDYKDDDEKEKKLQQLEDSRSCSTSHKGIPQSQNDNSNKYFRVGACNANSKSTVNQQKTIRNKVHGTLSNLIHRNSQPNKKNKQRQYSSSNNKKKSQRKTATPSRNKRKSQMINFKGTQKRIITKMIKLGRKCTRHFTSIKHSIENVVVQAIHKTHSLLEQHQHNSSNGVVDLSQRTMGSARRYDGNTSSRDGDKNRGMVDSKGKGSSSSHQKPNVPPNNAFYLTPNGFGC